MVCELPSGRILSVVHPQLDSALSSPAIMTSPQSPKPPKRAFNMRSERTQFSLSKSKTCSSYMHILDKERPSGIPRSLSKFRPDYMHPEITRAFVDGTELADKCKPKKAMKRGYENIETRCRQIHADLRTDMPSRIPPEIKRMFRRDQIPHPSKTI